MSNVEACPDFSQDPCINCGAKFHAHYGWSCNWSQQNPVTEFSKLDRFARFFVTALKGTVWDSTPSQPTLTSTSAPVPVSNASWQPISTASGGVGGHPVTASLPEVPEWKKLRDAATPSDHCFCGILRTNCDYHR